MPDRPPAARCCPIVGRSCPEITACPVSLPPPGAERAAILVLRFIAAARDTGDACCWDAALDHAEAAFGDRQGPLVVGRAGALVRRLAQSGADIAFLPPPCRRLSSGEAVLLDALRTRPNGALRIDLGPATEDLAALAHSVEAADPSSSRQAA